MNVLILEGDKMFEELEYYLQKLMKYGKNEEYGNAVNYFVCKLIESKYLFLLPTPSNIKRAAIFEESFSEEILMYNNFNTKNKVRPILFDLLCKEMKKVNPSIDSVINTLKEQTIILKKNEGLKEYFEVLDVEKTMMKNRNHITNRMRIYNIETKYIACRKFRDLISDMLEKEIPFGLESVYLHTDFDSAYVQMSHERKMHQDDLDLILERSRNKFNKFLREEKKEHENMKSQNKFLKNATLNYLGDPVLDTTDERFIKIYERFITDKLYIRNFRGLDTLKFKFSTNFDVFSLEDDIFEFLENL
ncbi:hypothetical protein D3C81_198760 [compost metagenome]